MGRIKRRYRRRRIRSGFRRIFLWVKMAFNRIWQVLEKPFTIIKLFLGIIYDVISWLLKRLIGNIVWGFRNHDKESILMDTFIAVFSLVIAVIFPVLYIPWFGLNAGFAIVVVIYILFVLLAVFKPVIGISLFLLLFFCIFGLVCTSDREEEATGGAKSKSAYGGNTGNRRYYGYGSRTVNIFSGMSENEARCKYRKLMKELHPDNNKDADPEECRRVNAAYEEYKRHLA